jgi:CheY-like chemotaxis protein
VIAVTAHALTGDEYRIREAGCDDYISKPLKKEVLWEKLDNAGIKL